MNIYLVSKEQKEWLIKDKMILICNCSHQIDDHYAEGCVTFCEKCSCQQFTAQTSPTKDSLELPPESY
jgi:hypothetical protein